MGLAVKQINIGSSVSAYVYVLRVEAPLVMNDRRMDVRNQNQLALHKRNMFVYMSVCVSLQLQLTKQGCCR